MYIKQITLKNIKSFKDVTFDFTRPDGSFAGWTVFVGGNGSGKTTVLRAIALALMGPRAGDIILGRNQGWISEEKTHGSVTATILRDNQTDKFLMEGTPPQDDELDAGVQWRRELVMSTPESKAYYVEFKAIDSSIAQEKGPWHPRSNGWFAVGYGPMRRLTGNSEDGQYLAEGNGRETRFVTLFEESASVGEGENWLRQMYARTLEARSDREAIDAIVQGAKALLNDGLLPEGISVSRITVDRVFVCDGRGVEMPLYDISDGCRSIIATVLDIVLKLYEIYGEKLQFSLDGKVNLPGVIIIDEAEAHLHPEWQRDLPEWFKKHFPNIQFIVSTHSPLIAQAADDNGLFILPGQGDVDSTPRRATDDELERIRLRTAYDALLETAFGLDTTRTPKTLNLMERWQWLDAKRRAGKLGESELDEYSELRGKMQIAFPAKSELADV
jgi:predicted ATPase